MKKLAIIITHPIQYYAPVFKLLAEQCPVKVFYTWGEEAIKPKHDPGFGKAIAWDIPLLEGYEYEFLENTASNPGSHHREGIINPDIVERISAFEPDALLVYGYAYESHFKAMRYFKGKIPVWFRGDSTLLDKDGFVKSIVKSIYLKWVYRYVDKAFYVGTQNKAYFKKYGLKEEQLVFAPHAIDNHRFAKGREAEVLQLRTKLGVLPEDILILFAGKLEPKKYPELLLDAFVALNQEIYPQNLCEMTKKNETTKVAQELQPTNNEQQTTSNEQRNIHLLFVGNGVLEESLKLRVESLKVKDTWTMLPDEKSGQASMTNRVHFMDFQNQSIMPVVYQACDVFCLPSQGPGETWGLAINEAMAAGKAILASDKVGCAVDLVKNGVNGYISESGNQEDLQNKLALLIHADLKEMGIKSQNMIQEWGFEAQVKTFITELHRIHA